MRQLLFLLLARHNSGELCCHATALVDFDLFDLMRYVDGKQLMLGRSVT